MDMPIDVLLLSKLIERHGASLQLWVRSCCDSPEDAVQEAFTRLATQDPVPDNPVAWLFRVSRNVALKRRLSDRRRRDRELATAQAEVVTARPDPLEVADLQAAVVTLADELRGSRQGDLIITSNRSKNAKPFFKCSDHLPVKPKHLFIWNSDHLYPCLNWIKKWSKEIEYRPYF